MATDHELWDALAGADADALAALFRRHSDAVYNFAFRRTASWATAEDVVQSTFTSVWRRARLGRVDALRAESARAVLLVMAGNECRNAARSGSRRRALLDRIGDSAVDPGRTESDHADRVADEIDDERRMSLVRRALDTLPSDQRAVVELVAWSHCTMHDVAVALDVPEGTIRSRLSRARTRLTGLLEIDGGDFR